MNYFVNENIFTKNSGIEFSATSRIDLFKKNNISAKILTRNYNPQLIDDIERMGLEPNDILNMYNYFQEITDVPKKDVNVRYTTVIDKNKYHIEGINSNFSNIKYHGNIVGKVNIAFATVGLVGSIESFDNKNNRLAEDIWDRRGFKSSTRYFHPNGDLGPQIFYNLNGEPKIELTRMNIDGYLSDTMFRLLDYKGRQWKFNNENELFTFFMNELVANEPSILINDRPSLINEVAKVVGAKGKWQFLHASHLDDNNKLSDYLKPLFEEYNEKFDGVIVPTKEQQRDIQNKFSIKNVVVEWDNFSQKLDILPISERDNDKLIFVGRIAPDKKPELALEVLSKVKEKLPNTRLEFYGYSSGNTIETKLDNFSNDLNLRSDIVYNGYMNQLELIEKIKDASGIINVSGHELFGDNVLLAMSLGIPAFVYDVKYGLNELINNGKNGFLELFNDSESLANDIVSVLSNSDKMKDMQINSYKKSEFFNEINAWKLWVQAKKDANNLFLE